MTEIPKCYAFNGDGLRCMQKAGHEGNHSHAIEWGDDEVWTPDHLSHGWTTLGNPPQMDVTNGPIPVTPLITEESVPERCDICEHPFHEEPCTVDVEFDDECGCSKAV